MTLDALIILVGAIIALVPSLGFPYSWDSVIFFILGIIVVALGIIVRRRLSHKSTHTPESNIENEQTM
jgi:membrane protein implicated in regulation of membrane protease activity